MGGTQAQGAQALGGKLGTGDQGGCRKVRTWSPKQHCQAGGEQNIAWGTLWHLRFSSLPFLRESVPPLWGLSPSPLPVDAALSCHDRQYLPLPPPFSPSWLLLPYVIIIARQSPRCSRSHASITSAPLPAPLPSIASPL